MKPNQQVVNVFLKTIYRARCSLSSKCKKKRKDKIITKISSREILALVED